MSSLMIWHLSQRSHLWCQEHSGCVVTTDLIATISEPPRIWDSGRSRARSPYHRRALKSHSHTPQGSLRTRRRLPRCDQFAKSSHLGSERPYMRWLASLDTLVSSSPEQVYKYRYANKQQTSEENTANFGKVSPIKCIDPAHSPPFFRIPTLY